MRQLFILFWGKTNILFILTVLSFKTFFKTHLPILFHLGFSKVAYYRNPKEELVWSAIQILRFNTKNYDELGSLINIAREP